MLSAENFIMVEKTAAMTIIMSSGFSTLQATPRKLRRYLSLKSRVTSCLRIYKDFFRSGYQAESDDPLSKSVVAKLTPQKSSDKHLCYSVSILTQRCKTQEICSKGSCFFRRCRPAARAPPPAMSWIHIYDRVLRNL